MNTILDIISAILFFFSYKYYDIFTASGVLIASYTCIIIINLIKNHHIDRIMWLTYALIVLFCGLTIIFHNQNFVQIKPSIIYLMLAIALKITPYFNQQQTTLESIFSAHVTLPAASWRALNNAWISLFVILAASNIYVWYYYDLTTWVYFKTFIVLSAVVGASVLQMCYFLKYAQK